MGERLVPAKNIPEHYEVTVTLTVEEYNRLKNDALWGGSGDVATYIKNMALGRGRRGC